MKRRAAFTLIELIIVFGIITLFSGAVYTVFSRMMVVHDTFDRRIAIQTRGNNALDAWRKDVSLAGSVSLAPDGRGVTVTTGPETQIEYLFADKKLLRRAPGSADQVLADQVVASAIEPVGGAWRISWTAEDSDGVRTWRRQFGALAAPLAPEVKP